MALPNQVLINGAFLDRVPAVVATPATFGSPLLIGAKIAAGNAPVNEIVLVTSFEEARDLFGAGSVLADMCRFAFANGEFNALYAMPVLEAGTAREVDITLGGAPVSGGQVVLSVGGEVYSADVVSGSDTDDIATSLVGAVNNDTDSLFNASASGSVVTLTGKTKRRSVEWG